MHRLWRQLFFIYLICLFTPSITGDSWFIAVVNSATDLQTGPQLLMVQPMPGQPWPVLPFISPCELSGLENPLCFRSAGDSLLLLDDGASFLLSVGCRATYGELCHQDLSAIFKIDLSTNSGSVLYRADTAPSSPLSGLFRPYSMTKAASAGSFVVTNLMSDAVLECAEDGTGCVHLQGTVGCNQDRFGVNGPCGIYSVPGEGIYMTTEGSVPACTRPGSCTPTFPPNVSSALLFLRAGQSTACPSLVAAADPGGSMTGVVKFREHVYVTDFTLNLIYAVAADNNQTIVDRLQLDPISLALPCYNACYTGELLLVSNATEAMLVAPMGSLTDSGGVLAAFRLDLTSPKSWWTGPFLLTAWTSQFNRPMGLAAFPLGKFTAELLHSASREDESPLIYSF